MQHLDLSILMDNYILQDSAVLSDIAFKLISFKNKVFSKIQYDTFLQHHISSIQKLIFYQVDYPQDLVTIFKMPHLKELHLGNTSIDLNMPLALNTSIEKLEFFDRYSKFTLAQSIINAASNVKHLTIFWLTQEIMEEISIKMKHLKTLLMNENHHTYDEYFPIRRDPIEKFLKHVKIMYITKNDLNKKAREM